jgi:cytidylate kinase
VHVRLIAPLSWRAKKIATERKIDAHEAEAIAVREERQREAFVRDFTGEGVADPPRHDVVFNSAQVEIETVAEAIFSMMKNKRLT